MELLRRTIKGSYSSVALRLHDGDRREALSHVACRENNFNAALGNPRSEKSFVIDAKRDISSERDQVHAKLK